MNQENINTILLLISIFGWIILLFVGIMIFSDAVNTSIIIQDILTCEQLSKFYEDTHLDYTQTLILEKCVLGEKP